MKASRGKSSRAALIGVGLDGDDGHTRLTRGEDMVLYGGSEETHSVMQETAIKVKETLSRRGKGLEEVSGTELRDIFLEATGE